MTRIVVFRALTVLIGGLCRHIRLHVRVVGGDLSFASIFTQSPATIVSGDALHHWDSSRVAALEFL